MLAMTKFVLLYHGFTPPLPGRQAAWSVWLQRRAASFVDAGTAFGPGRVVTTDQTFELSLTVIEGRTMANPKKRSTVAPSA